MDDHNSYGQDVHKALAAIGPAVAALGDEAAKHAQAAAAQEAPGRPSGQPTAAGQPAGGELSTSDNLGLSPKP